MAIFTNPNRLDVLHLILQYCTQTGGVFTTGERICINQERGKLLMIEDTEPIDIFCPVYPHSEYLDKKIEAVLLEIAKRKWEAKPHFFF